MTGRTGGLWANGDFRKLWSGQAVALVGQQFGVLALPLVAILTLNAGASAVALLIATASVPTVLFGLFVGVVVDRLSRRSVIIATNLGRAVVLATIPIAAICQVLTMPQLYAVAFLIGTLDICFLTAYRSYVPSVVPKADLPRAYAAVGASDGVTRTAAPSLAGGVVQLLTAPAGIAVQGCCYLVAAWCNWTIRRPENPRQGRNPEPMWAAFRAGLAYSRWHPIVRAFAISDAVYIFFWSLLQSVLLVFLSRQLELAPGVIGVIFTVGTLGGVLAAFVAGRIGRWLKPGPTIIAGSVMRSVGMVLLPLAALLGPFAIPALMITRLINAFGWTLWEVHQETVLQLLLPDRLRGRVNAAVIFLSGCALAFGPTAAAAIVELTNVLATLTIGGIGTMLAIAFLFTSRLRTLRELPTEPDENAG